MTVTAVNEKVSWQRGSDGTIVVMSAWCETCQAQAMPIHDSECSFCGSVIVDLDTLKTTELINGGARVVQLREPPAPTLQIADGFTLPIDVAGEATAVLAKRGAGKTNTGRVLAEEYVRAGVHLVVIDPLGVWWGLRSSADGEHDGLAVPILGGEHGDLPLAVWQGVLTAGVVVSAGASVILDLSDLSKDEQRTFVADFAEELYRLKRRQRSVTHVILEEADEFAPQRARAGGDAEEVSRMRGAVETLARRGRSSGIGLTFITQRSAALSKDVLTQADTLIAMRTTGPTDIKAIQEWVTRNADGGDAVVRSLAGLKTGESWVWSPEREVLARIQVRLADTWDSSATPKYGEERVEPRRRAAVALPLELDRAEEPPPDLDADHRLRDEDGLWGCKIDGCAGRSRHRAGPLAFLCPDHGGPAHEDPEPETAVPAGEARPRQAARAPAVVLPDPGVLEQFGITGPFGRDAARVRSEADRLRRQADALDRIAEALDELAASA